MKRRYYILIVEDEPLERNALQEQLANLPSIAGISAAATVESAIESIKAKTPDLVLLDIMLMGSSGFEVAAFLKDNFPLVKILILTAYNEFDFAHRAIDLGITGYLLKPIKPDLLLQRIKEVLAEGEKESDLNLLWPYLEDDSFATVRHRLAAVPTVIAALYDTNQDWLPLAESEISGWGWAEKKGNWVFLFLSPLDQEPRKLWELFLRHGLKVGVGFSQSGTGNVSQAYKAAIEARRGAVFFPGAVALTYEEYLAKRERPGSYPFEIEAALFMAIDNAGDEIILQRAREVGEHFLTKSGRDGEVLQKWLRNLSYGLTRFAAQKGFDHTPDLEGASLTGPPQMIEQIKKAAAALADLLAGERGNQNPLVAKAFAIIRSRFHQDLKLEDVAKELYVSPVYLSRLFKQEVGVNFRSSLIQVRLETAAVLLLNSNVSIGEVAQKVGYNDGNYFSHSFRVRYGVSPREYQKARKPL